MPCAQRLSTFYHYISLDDVSRVANADHFASSPFLPPVLSNVSSLFQVLYNMAIWTNETEPPGPSPMAPPSVNVSLTGTVPQEPITFRLDLPCLGLRSAEVDVILNINVTSPRPRQPPTVLYFKRRKICLEGEC